MSLGKYWRFSATFFCFMTFGIGGMTLPLIVRPLLWIVIRNPLQRQRTGKRMVHYSFRAFVEIMQFLGVIRYRVSGTENLAKTGQLILANHPTLIDVVLLIAFVKNADCVVKESLFKNPATYGAITMAGYITNDSPAKMLDKVARSLQQGNNVIIFPEGTRTTLNEPLKLKRGAANIALTSSSDITPVIITCSPPALSKEHRWYEAADERVNLSIDIRDSININQFSQSERTSHSSRQLTRYLEWYFSEALALH